MEGPALSATPLASTKASPASAQFANGPLQVTITDLGLLPGGIYASAYAINDTGKIVGMAYDADFNLVTVQWLDGQISVIPGLTPSASSVPADINDAGEIAGTLKVGGQNDGIYWDAQNVPHQLDGLPGVMGSFVQAHGINASGQIVGRAQEGGPTLWGHAAVWLGSVFQSDLGFMGGGHYTEAYGINDLGEIVGGASIANTSLHAFLRQGGQYTDLSTWSGGGAASIAYGINNHGQIVGLNSSVASLWEAGSVAPLPMPPGISAFTPAIDINDAGDIIATGAKVFPAEVGVLWRNGQPIDLGTLPGGTISRARRINASGEVVGEAKAANGFFHAVKWTVTRVQWADLGQGLAGTHGVPQWTANGSLTLGSTLQCTLSHAKASSVAWLVVGFSQSPQPFFGGTLVPAPDLLIPVATNPAGALSFAVNLTTAVPSGQEVSAQVWLPDAAGTAGWAASNAISQTAP